MLLPGTCCRWRANFGGMIPPLEPDFHVVCVIYVGFDETETESVFPDMITETEWIGMETTGHYWLALYTHLRQEGHTVRVISAVQSDALRGMYIRQAKNDSRDSFIIAEVIRLGRFCETAVSAPELHKTHDLEESGAEDKTTKRYPFSYRKTV